MIKKALFIFTILFINLAYAKINAVVSIMPQETFVEAIGGDKVNVSLMVKPGESPHTYEPKPSQMREISKANIYFAIGVEFENVWIPKFANQNKKMKIVSVARNIEQIEMGEHYHYDKDGNKIDEEPHKHGDPHIWTSPKNVKQIAKNIHKYLSRIDKKNKEYYSSNLNKFLQKVDETDKRIKEILKDTKEGTKFMIFHPACGYFARDYSLMQIAIEAGGKSPKPKKVLELIKEAKKENIKAIFTNPELSDKIAKQMASELGIPVVRISPLNPKWEENLINFAKAIANK